MRWVSNIPFAPGLPVQATSRSTLNILMIYDTWATRTGNLRDHLTAFRIFGRNRVCFIDWRTLVSVCHKIDAFDVVVIHYSVIIAQGRYLTPEAAAVLESYKGYKVLFIQDEYRWVNATAEAIARLGIDVMYSVINEDVRDLIYHHPQIRHVRRKTTLTGFVSENLVRENVPSYKDRCIDVGYRARKVHASLGRFAQEKWLIGRRFAEEAGRYGLRCDIEHDERKRIYGRAWIDFVMNCRAMLGTESGASFIDYEYNLTPEMDAYENAHPDKSAAEIQAHFMGYQESETIIHVISPRCFEAAALRTLMILYPGTYSGILKPWRHYVPLEKDHSNMDEVVAVVRNPKQAEEIIGNAYREIALNPKYGLPAFIAHFDEDLDKHARTKAASAAVGVATLGVTFEDRERNSERLIRSVERRSRTVAARERIWLGLKWAIYRMIATLIQGFPRHTQPVIWRFLKAVASRFGLIQRI